MLFRSKKIKRIINEEKRKNDILTKRIEELEEWKNLKNIINSRIIEKRKEIDFIIDRLKNNEEKKKKNIFFKKIYSAIEDGDSTSIFHQKCDGQKNIIAIINTIKGAKFGVYTNVGFGLGSGVYIQDDELFHFNINNYKIYNVKKGLNQVERCQSNICGIDINCGIHTNYNFFSGDKNHCIIDSMINYYEGLENEFELNLGEKYFISSEVEVFKIILY